MNKKPYQNTLREAFFNGNGIARRLIIALILFSSALTAVITTLQLYGEYQDDVDNIHSSFSYIEQSSVPVLVDSVWVSDDLQIKAQIEGLLNLRDMEYAGILVDGDVAWSVGTPVSKRTLSKRIDLVRAYRGQAVQIGELMLVASLDKVWSRIWQRLVVLLVENGIKTLLVAMFMLLVFQLLVTRHLAKLSLSARNYDPDIEQNEVLSLDRPATGRWRPDALDYLVNAINDMRHKLQGAYAEMRDSEKRLRLAMGANNEGVWDWSVKEGRVYYNTGWARMLGYEPGELEPVYATWESRIHPADRGLVLEALESHLDGQTERFYAEHRLKTKAGKWLWVVGRGRVIEYNSEGKPMRAVGTMADISAQKAAELQLKHMNEELEHRVSLRTQELLEARDEAERASQAKSTFLSRMSHELRTPLNAILGFGQLLENEEKGSLSVDQNEYVHEILFAGRHLLDLINEVLDLARIESGRETLDMKAVDINGLIHECVALIRPLAEKYQIDLHYQVADDMEIFADPLRARQVILNLLTNAVKYNRQGGQVTLSVSPAEGNQVRFAVTDTGEGINAENMDKLFLPFERLGNTENVEGTGIGLALSKRLVEAMDGAIGVHSEPGKGSTFWVLFRKFFPERSMA